VWEIDDDEYVVIYPFKDYDYPTAWDSAKGHDLAMRVTEHLNAYGDFNVVPYGSVLELLIAPPVEPKESDGDARGDQKHPLGIDVRELTPRKLGELTAADYVLVCNILKWEIQDPKNINMTRGTATAEVRLFKLAKGKTEIEQAEMDAERARRIDQARTERGLAPLGEPLLGGWFIGARNVMVTAHFPTDYLNQYGEIFLEPELVRQGLLKELAKKVSYLLYEHDPPDTPGSGS